MKKIFIIPYRDRAPHKEIFLNQMEKILDDEIEYEILFCHQCDQRKFNRGGMRNIGFLYAKEKYSNWKDITFIFHDIDYLPYTKLFNYETVKGTVTHFYGLKFAFGGIWAIKGIDYEKIKGFPNYWAWGFEDNKIRDKWVKIGGKINYDQFIHYSDKRVVKLDCSLHGHDKRLVNRHNLHFAVNDNYKISGFHTIRDLKYNIEDVKKNVKMINITNFLTERAENSQKYAHNITSKDIQIDHKRRIEKNRKKQKPKVSLMKMNIMDISKRRPPPSKQQNIPYIAKKKNILKFSHYRFKKT